MCKTLSVGSLLWADDFWTRLARFGAPSPRRRRAEQWALSYVSNTYAVQDGSREKTWTRPIAPYRIRIMRCAVLTSGRGPRQVACQPSTCLQSGGWWLTRVSKHTSNLSWTGSWERYIPCSIRPSPNTTAHGVACWSGCPHRDRSITALCMYCIYGVRCGQEVGKLPVLGTNKVDAPVAKAVIV